MVKSVVVIGGGIAGITVASRLARNPDFSVTLLEASDRIGGRVHTVKRESAGSVEQTEKGAQWVHGENSITALARKYGDDILEDDPYWEKLETGSSFGTSSGAFITAPATLKKFLGLLTTLREGPTERDCGDLSVGNWFLKKIKAKEFASDSELCAFINWLERLQINIDGSDTWFESSVRGQLEYISCPGCSTISWTQGYQALINIILNENPSVSELPSWAKLNSQVTQIDYTSRPIITRTEDGTTYESDAVVVTVSLGVLKAIHQDLFKPNLPHDKIRTIQNLGFGTVNKLHLQFTEIWWEDDWQGIHLLWPDENTIEFPSWAKSVLGFYPSKFSPKTLTGWITGHDARTIEKLDSEILTDIIVKLLRKFSGNERIPRPTLYMTKWFTNPLFQGSYSFRSVESEETDVWAKDLAQPIEVPNNGLLCFAGEATHNSFYSTVHGAYDTGIREANRLIQFYSTSAEPETVDK